MRTLLLVPFVLMLSACATTSVVHDPVNVEVPVAFCPPPPTVPSHDFQVDKLQPTDVNDPGKVGQAYKADMAYLREAQRIYIMILEQYGKTSQNFEEVQKRVKELADKIKPPATPPSQ